MGTDAPQRTVGSPAGGKVLFALDARLRYTYWSRAAECLTGIGACDAVGRSLYEVFPDAPGSPAEAQYLDVLRTGRAVGMDTRFDDTRYRVSAFPVPAGVVVTAREITPCPGAVDRSPSGAAAVAVVRNGEVLTVNARFVNMFGCSGPEEAAGASLLGFICPEHRGYVAALIGGTGRADPSGVELTLQARRADGGRFGVTVWGCPVPLPDGAASAVFFVERPTA